MSDVAPAARSIPAPIVNPETQVFWDAARDGKFLIKRCTACGKAHWYPRAICPHCHSDQTVWEESPGEGVIYSYSITRRAPAFIIAYVALDEGPALLTNLVAYEGSEPTIGQRVKVRWTPTEGGPPVYVFAPA